MVRTSKIKRAVDRAVGPVRNRAHVIARAGRVAQMVHPLVRAVGTVAVTRMVITVTGRVHTPHGQTAVAAIVTAVTPGIIGTGRVARHVWLGITVPDFQM